MFSFLVTRVLELHVIYGSAFPSHSLLRLIQSFMVMNIIGASKQKQLGFRSLSPVSKEAIDRCSQHNFFSKSSPGLSNTFHSIKPRVQAPYKSSQTKTGNIPITSEQADLLQWERAQVTLSWKLDMLALVSMLSQGLPLAFDPFLLNLGLMESLCLFKNHKKSIYSCSVIVGQMPVFIPKVRKSSKEELPVLIL